MCKEAYALNFAIIATSDVAMLNLPSKLRCTVSGTIEEIDTIPKNFLVVLITKLLANWPDISLISFFPAGCWFYIRPDYYSSPDEIGRITE